MMNPELFFKNILFLKYLILYLNHNKLSNGKEKY
jgi:hypothetical protein